MRPKVEFNDKKMLYAIKAIYSLGMNSTLCSRKTLIVIFAKNPHNYNTTLIANIVNKQDLLRFARLKTIAIWCCFCFRSFDMTSHKSLLVSLVLFWTCFVFFFFSTKLIVLH